MIITRTPLRLAIGGGGTDLPSYYTKFGSFFISGAINKYVYITFYRTPLTSNIRLKYSQMEDVDRVDEIRHAIVRETFRLHGVGDSAEMASHADIPGGTGLGTSGSFGVGLSHALLVSKNEDTNPHRLAEDATKVQMEILGYPIGKQDQYAAAFGGVNCYEVAKDGRVIVTPLKIAPENVAALEGRLVMFFTGISRSANEILVTQKEKSEADDPKMIEALHYTQKLGFEIKEALENGDFAKFGKAMDAHWKYKKARSPKMTSPQIDQWYDLALKNGALGGKLVGAGGGGFLVFYADDREKLISAMTTAGLRYIPFKFDFEGSQLLFNE
ncbi:MAG: galactokinase [Parcubacteria group bacterium]|nr:galactokinase [Parcubacteria group bacterium]